MLITRTCPFTREHRSWDIDVEPSQIYEWQNGKLIQEAMPDLTADEREFILTGISPDAWPSP